MPAVTNEAKPKRTPKFNWFRARELARNGATAPDIAEKMGVSVAGVTRILNRNSYETTTVQDNYSLNKTCATDDCNTSISNNSTVCRPHHAASLTTSVRDTTVKCSACQAWKPDESCPKDARKTARAADATGARPAVLNTEREPQGYACRAAARAQPGRTGKRDCVQHGARIATKPRGKPHERNRNSR